MHPDRAEASPLEQGLEAREAQANEKSANPPPQQPSGLKVSLQDQGV